MTSTRRPGSPAGANLPAARSAALPLVAGQAGAARATARVGRCPGR
jgi:hypothetical protein